MISEKEALEKYHEYQRKTALEKLTRRERLLLNLSDLITEKKP